MRRVAVTLTLLSMLVACSAEQPTSAPTDDVPTPSPTVDDQPSSTPTTPAPSPIADDPETPDEQPATPTASPAAAPDAPDRPAAAPFPADTSDDTGEGSGFVVTVADIRVGRHDGFDRIVFDTGGDGQAGWHVGYVDEATTQGAGERLEVAGSAILHVDLVHTGYPDDTGTAAYDGPRRIAGGDVVTEAVYVGVYEGHTQVYVGVDGERPFRVFRLDDRVVLDVWHEGVG